MDLCEFHSQIYGTYNNQLFLFEPTWDSFRPIEYVGWNGERYVPIDTLYTQNLFDDQYGYGTLEMKTLCKKLLRETELGNAKLITDPILFWKWCGKTDAHWWNDRACVFTSACVSRDTLEWKKYLHYLNVKSKTLRRAIRSRMTRRLLPKSIHSSK
jgi:hypothetical protein